MKLEELTNIVNDCKEVRVFDSNNNFVAKWNDTDGIPAFLAEVEVDKMSVRSDGTLDIYTLYDNQLACLEHLKGLIRGLENAIEDDYGITSVDDVNRRIMETLQDVENDSQKIWDALNQGAHWDYYL